MATQPAVRDATNTPPQPEWQNTTLINERANERAQLLVDNWNYACTKLADLYSEVEAIQEAFDKLKTGQDILGCTGFKVFCIRHLRRDPSTVYRMLKKARLELEPAVEEEPLFEQGEPGEEEDEDEEEGEQASAKKSKKRPRIDMREATNAHYADRYLSMIGLLTNAPKETSPQQIIETIRAEAQAAYEDLDAETAKKIKIPKLVKLPDADYTNLKTGITALKAENDSLKQRLRNLQAVPENLRDETITSTLAAEPDRGEASAMLADHLRTVTERVLPAHITLDTLQNPNLLFAGRDHRICIGDFLRKQDWRGGEDAPIQLAKCTGIGECEKRRRVREWVEGKWGKEHVVYHDQECSYTVITEAKARELAPSAFENL